MIKTESLSALALAYLGDSVYEQAVRTHIVCDRLAKPNELHRLSTRYVSAKAQAAILARLVEQEFLTDQEQMIMKRGRNAKSATKAKNTDVLTYRHSTGFEAVIGYLYLEGQQQRLSQFIQQSIIIAEQLMKEA